MGHRTLATFLLLMLVGCQNVPEQKGILEERVKDNRISSAQLSALMHEFVSHSFDVLVEGADRIMEETGDPEIYRNALRWKINAVSTCYRASAQRDALAALIDVSLLCEQMIHFLRDGEGCTLFGAHQMIAVEVALKMKADIESIALRITDDKERLASFGDMIRENARNHPVESLYFVRPSMEALYLGYINSKGGNLADVVGSMTQDIQTLLPLMLIFMERLPELARWEGELLLLDAPPIAIDVDSIEGLEPLLGCVERLTTVAEEAPALVQSESKIALDAIHMERVESFEEIERMRIDTMVGIEGLQRTTMDDIGEERKIVLEEVKKERIAVVEAIREERIAAFDEIYKLQDKTMKEVDAIIDHKLQEVGVKGEGLIDHFMWRLIQFTGGLGVVLIIAFLVFKKLGAA